MRGLFLLVLSAFWKDSQYEHAKKLFEIGTDKNLFDGLYISGNKELCDDYMIAHWCLTPINLKGATASAYLLEHRPNEDMLDKQLQALTPWSEEV